MGVSVCGKSTVGAQFAERLGMEYLEGDQLHSPQNITRLASGVALNDADRVLLHQPVQRGLLGLVMRVVDRDAIAMRPPGLVREGLHALGIETLGWCSFSGRACQCVLLWGDHLLPSPRQRPCGSAVPCPAAPPPQCGSGPAQSRATISMCIIFAASSGVIGATESVVGLLTIPVMLRYKYDKALISGAICAEGSLGTIIPPSVVAVVMGPLANVSVGDQLYGMAFPGLIMAGLYLLYMFTLCVIKPEVGPRIPPESGEPRITTMIMTVLLAGTLFTGVFIGGGGINTANNLINKLQLTPWMLLGLMMLIIFIAGFFLDWISIVLIFVPLFTPLAEFAGFDPVWFCILFLIMIQTSYLTPPMAPAIFHLRAVTPAEITIRHMYTGVVPFTILQCVTLVITMAFPAPMTWLPGVMLNFK